MTKLKVVLMNRGLVMSARYGFKLEAYLYSYRNHFPNRVYTGRSFADLLVNAHASSALRTIPYATQEVSIAEVQLQGNYLHILFHLYDPLIPDPDYVDKASGGIRTAQRRQNEEPARSAHLIMDVSSAYDQTKAYPVGLENAEYLSRTLISKFLNDTLEQLTSSDELWISSSGAESLKRLSQRLKFRADFSQTIDGLLDSGGMLVGVKAVSANLIETDFGDQAYPVVEENDLSVKVLNRPTKSAAKDILRGIWARERERQPKKVSVTIEDTVEGRLKTIGVDTSKGNILENIFIRQKSLGVFNPPLRLCEPNLRPDVIAEMKRRLV